MTFDVTNPGNIPVRDIEVTDDRGLTVVFTGGDTDDDTELDPGETWTYQANVGPAPAGRFDNVGTVTGLDVLEQPLTDTTRRSSSPSPPRQPPPCRRRLRPPPRPASTVGGTGLHPPARCPGLARTRPSSGGSR